MARIPDDELERLKRETDLAELIRRSGVELRRRGKDLVGRCPFHEGDDDPSLVVTPSKGLFHCFGCGAAGSVIDWVRRFHGVSFPHAVEILRQGLPSSAAASAPATPVKHTTVPKLPAPVDLGAGHQELLEQTMSFYNETLLSTSDGLDCLVRRGIRDDEAIERFRIGYSNRTLGFRLPKKNRKNGADIRGKLQEIGLIRETGHEHFSGCLTFPILDADGHVGDVYGRKVSNSLRKGTVYHLYLPGPHKGVWNLDALRESQEVILCESIIDALSFWVNGFRNVTSAFGAGCFTGEQVEAFKAHGIERTLIAFDRDKAGDDGAEAVARRLAAEGIGCFRVVFPRGMDANEYARKVTPAPKSLDLLLRKAEWLAGPTRLRREAGVGRWETGETEAQHDRADTRVPGADRLAKGHGLGAGDLPAGKEAATGGALRPEQSDPPSRDLDPGQHRGGAGETASSGVCAAPVDSTGQPGGAGPSPGSSPSIDLPDRARPESSQPSNSRGSSAPPRSHPKRPEEEAVTSPDSRLPTPVSVTTIDGQIVIPIGDREYRVRGLSRNMTYEQLKVMLRVIRGERFYLDTVDLVSSRQRGHFIKEAAREIEVKPEVVKKDLGRVQLKLEELQDQQIKAAQEPKKPRKPTVSDAERTSAMALLKDPRLLDRILEDFDRCGVVGEQMNKLTGYLAAISRKLERPLAVIIQSSSAAGKSALMEAILAFVPPEERVKYSAMTGQSVAVLHG